MNSAFNELSEPGKTNLFGSATYKDSIELTNTQINFLDEENKRRSEKRKQQEAEKK